MEKWGGGEMKWIFFFFIAFSYFSITSHFSFLLFHTAKGMNKDGAGPSSWSIKENEKKKKNKEGEKGGK